MKTVEENLKNLIVSKYGTMVNFSSKIGMSNSTLAAIINRGVNNASVSNLIKICNELDISADALAGGEIKPNINSNAESWNFKDVSDVMTFVKIALSSSKEITIYGQALTNDDKQSLIDAFELSCEFIRRKSARDSIK